MNEIPVFPYNIFQISGMYIVANIGGTYQNIDMNDRMVIKIVENGSYNTAPEDKDEYLQYTVGFMLDDGTAYVAYAKRSSIIENFMITSIFQYNDVIDLYVAFMEEGIEVDHTILTDKKVRHYFNDEIFEYEKYDELKKIAYIEYDDKDVTQFYKMVWIDNHRSLIQSEKNGRTVLAKGVIYADTFEYVAEIRNRDGSYTYKMFDTFGERSVLVTYTSNKKLTNEYNVTVMNSNESGNYYDANARSILYISKDVM